MTYGMTLPIIGLGYMAVKTAAEFGKSMAMVGIATETSGKKLESLGGYAMKMGKDTIFSANEASEGMLELAKAGMTSAQIKGGSLKATMDLAAAGSQGLAESALQIGAAMNTFSIRATKSTVIADALAGGANNTSASLSGLAMSLSQAGQQAEASGLNIFETTGVISAFADKGIQASDAGTSFKVFLQRLNPYTEKAKKKMNELGMSFFNSEGNMKNMRNITKELRNSLSGLAQKQRLTALQTLFGSDAQRAANIVYKLGPKEINKYIKATRRKGEAERMAQAQMTGLAGAIHQFKGSLETAGIAAGEALTPMVIVLAGSLKFLLDGFTSLPKPMRIFVVSFIAILGIAGPIIFMVGAMTSAFAYLGISLLLTMAGVAVILAIGIALVYAYKKVEFFRKAVDAVFGFLKANWKLILGIIVAPIALAVILVIKHWGKIKGAAGSILGWLKKHWKLILGIIVAPVALSVVLIIKHWGTIKKAAGSVVNFIKNRFNDFIGFVKSLPGKIGSAASGLFNGIKDAFKSAINWIISKWNGLELKIGGMKIDPPGPGSITIPDVSLKTPYIPPLAAGGRILRSGLSLVGEKGPELQWQPRGAIVQPLTHPGVVPPTLEQHDLSAWQRSGDVTVPVELKIREKVIATAVAKASGDDQARA